MCKTPLGQICQNCHRLPSTGQPWAALGNEGGEGGYGGVDKYHGGSHMIPARGEVIHSPSDQYSIPVQSTSDPSLMGRSAADMAELVLRG